MSNEHEADEASAGSGTLDREATLELLDESIRGSIRELIENPETDIVRTKRFRLSGGYALRLRHTQTALENDTDDEAGAMSGEIVAIGEGTAADDYDDPVARFMFKQPTPEDDGVIWQVPDSRELALVLQKGLATPGTDLSARSVLNLLEHARQRMYSPSGKLQETTAITDDLVTRLRTVMQKAINQEPDSVDQSRMLPTSREGQVDQISRQTIPGDPDYEKVRIMHAPNQQPAQIVTLYGNGVIRYDGPSLADAADATPGDKKVAAAHWAASFLIRAKNQS